MNNYQFFIVFVILTVTVVIHYYCFKHHPHINDVDDIEILDESVADYIHNAFDTHTDMDTHIDTHIESFDAKIPNININECSDVCTSIYGCQGFAHTKNNCYVSKNLIIQKPIIGVYIDEYSPETKRCNKVYPLKEKTNLETRQDRDYNTIYSCADTERDRWQLKRMVNKDISDLSGVNIESMPHIPYDMDTIIWPVNQRNFVLTELLDKRKENNKSITMFKKDKQEYLGQYLLPNKCEYDVSEKDCLTKCANNPDCVGTDWAPVSMSPITIINNNKTIAPNYGNYATSGPEQLPYNYTPPKQAPTEFNIKRNICCPKRIITDKVDRRKQNEYGQFYIKNTIKQNDLVDNVYIINQ